MALVRWQRLSNELTDLQTEMNYLFGRPTEDSWPTLARAYPAVNIWEDDDNVYVEAELPGLTQDPIPAGGMYTISERCTTAAAATPNTN